jgi:hypothetical protein
LLIVSSLITLRCLRPMLPTRPDSNNAPILVLFCFFIYFIF